MNKPIINKSTLILLESHNTKPYHMVLPLSDMRVEQHKDKYILTIYGNKLMSKELQQYKYDRALIAMTNDPRMTHAADWSDLGTFKILFKLPSPVLRVNKNSVSFTVDMKNIKELEQRLNMADRL